MDPQERLQRAAEALHDVLGKHVEERLEALGVMSCLQRAGQRDPVAMGAITLALAQYAADVVSSALQKEGA